MAGITTIVAGIGGFGLLLVLIGMGGIRRSRRRRTAPTSPPSAEPGREIPTADPLARRQLQTGTTGRELTLRMMAPSAVRRPRWPGRQR
jgi:hypothetical protein